MGLRKPIKQYILICQRVEKVICWQVSEHSEEGAEDGNKTPCIFNMIVSIKERKGEMTSAKTLYTHYSLCSFLGKHIDHFKKGWV